MRVVLDTNVLMSGVFFGGVPGRLLEAWATRRFQLVVSPGILEEYRRVGAELAARYPTRAEALSPILALITMHAVLVEAPQPARPVSRDPTDEMFLAAARAAGATVVVSGDRHLLEVSGWHGLAVLTPREFVDRYLRQE